MRSWAPCARRTVLASFALVASLCLSVVACTTEKIVMKPGEGGSSGSSGGSRPTTTLFEDAITNVTVEVDYGSTAVPYVDLEKFGNVWALGRANVLAIFDGKKAVTMPRSLADMEELPDLIAGSYTDQNLLDVAAAHRHELPTENTATFYVVFIDGYWIDETGTERFDILTRSVGDTGVIAIFKPVVASAQGAALPLVEQLAFVHAIGHAVGFVNDGVPVAESNLDHIDETGHHCTNTQCAMAYHVETPEGAASYAATLIRSPEAVLIGQECLSDARLLEKR